MNKENSAPARILPTIDENPTGPTPQSGSPSNWSHQFFAEYGTPATLQAHDVADERVNCATVIVDNSAGVYGGLQSHVTGAGAAGAELVCKYSPTLSMGDMADFAKLSIATANADVPRQSIPLLLPSDSRVKKLLLALFLRGGDAVITPEMWNAIVFAASGRPPTVPTTGPQGPLPEGAPWGNIIAWYNANSTQMREMYGDGDDVNLWPDETGNGWDLSTVETLLLPKWKEEGIVGGLPCVEWNGANPYLSNAANPTAPHGSYTYYFVIEGLDGGGDGARLWGAGLGDSFQYSYYANSSQVYAANNNLFGSPSIYASDSGGTAWGMPNKHIYRFTKNSGSASHQIWVGGVQKGSAGAAPGTNNDGIAYCMDYLAGIGLAGRIGEVVVYDGAHMSPTNVGSPADGLTAPELVLQDFWGTP